jgi:glycosyltransferase involved in cell wall biosynthesis
MRIAVVSQYFWPEPFAINDLVRTLAEQGHTVDVYTGKPNYPDGLLYAGYSQPDVQIEPFVPGVMIHRVPLRPRGKSGAVNLVRNYFSFVWNGCRYFPGLAKDKKYDVIFAVNLSPITAVIPAIRLRRLLKVPLVMWVLDVWPDSLQATGYIKHPLAIKMIGQLVRWIYSKADRILVQSRAFIAPVGKYAGTDKLLEYAASAPDMPTTLPDDGGIPADVLSLLEQNFCVVFTGNLGRAQALDVLLDAATLLQDIPDFKLVLVGSGSLSEWLQEQKQQRKLDNVVLTGRYPPAAMPQFLVRSKALVVALSAQSIFAQTVPAKIQTYMAAGKPIVASLDGEGARVIQASGAGLNSPAGNAEQLAENFRRIYNMTPDKRSALGQAGRAYFLENFEIQAQAKKLVQLLQLPN